MAKPYTDREFCRYSKCAIQNQIDSWGLDEDEIKRLKKRCCDCMSYKFYQYLKENNYTIVDFGKPLIDEAKG